MAKRPSPKPFTIEVKQGQTAAIIVHKGKKKLYTHKLQPGHKISIRVGTHLLLGPTISPSKKP